ncbi:MAG: fructose-bisphosphate aldolase class I, partial [Alphaproteobacteria bacterium]|nr:fructose-bisphosphate aldolase class I [Alphaproteobacteria bacterium]
QEANIVPIVEPEVIMDGAHSLKDCYEVSELVLRALYQHLAEQGVHLEGTILKPNMIVSGTKHATQAGVAEVAQATIKCFNENVPHAVAGIVFLSGGQSDIDATAHLDAMNRLGTHPWALSFSFGRALQAAPLKAWGGESDNVKAAQAAFAHRAKMNGLAAQGKWQSSLEN